MAPLKRLTCTWETRKVSTPGVLRKIYDTRSRRVSIYTLPVSTSPRIIIYPLLYMVTPGLYVNSVISLMRYHRQGGELYAIGKMAHECQAEVAAGRCCHFLAMSLSILGMSCAIWKGFGITSSYVPCQLPCTKQRGRRAIVVECLAEGWGSLPFQPQQQCQSAPSAHWRSPR